MGNESVDSGLSAACAIAVLFVTPVCLVILNILQTFSLGAIVSPTIWAKALICVFPLSLSIFLLVPLLSGPLVVHKTRISLVSTLLQRPIELATISFSGAALHYLLPILNPIVNVNVDQQPLTLYLVFSGLFSGLFFYFNLVSDENSSLNYPTFRIGWPTRVMLTTKPVLNEALISAITAYKISTLSWLVITFIFSLPVWPLLNPLFQVKLFGLFVLSQSLLKLCLSVAQAITTNPRVFQIDTALVGEESLIQLLNSKSETQRNSAFQDLAILTRYADPRRSQIYQLSIPGGKPKTWNAIWSSCNYILSDFARKMDDINLPSQKPKSPSKKENGQTEPVSKATEPSNTYVRNRFGEPHLWSKQSSLISPTRQKSTPSTPKANAESMFLSKNKDENESLVSTLSERAIQVLSNMVFSMLNKIKSPFCYSISSIRPINFLISERPEYKISCLIGDVNHVRLVVIALANILSAAPAEDKYGVTQVGLKESLKLFNRLNKGLDIIVRNNQQRTELRKLRNETKTALGKITNAFGESLDQL